ncbi:MAG: helix-turn-helix transcriptional regulator [Acidobacteria bacterium]|nr:helix-turn-helix transcriptional regulator [Acidobacteriota bacterium]
MFKQDDDTCDLIQIDLNRVRQLRGRMVDAPAVASLAEIFRVLGDPTRVRLLDVLSHGELCVCDLSAVVQMSQSAVSHQLRLLRSLRLVRARREGRMVFYALDDRHVVDLLREGLTHVHEAPARRTVKPRKAAAR